MSILLIAALTLLTVWVSEEVFKEFEVETAEPFEEFRQEMEEFYQLARDSDHFVEQWEVVVDAFDRECARIEQFRGLSNEDLTKLRREHRVMCRVLEDSYRWGSDQ